MGPSRRLSESVLYLYKCTEIAYYFNQTLKYSYGCNRVSYLGILSSSLHVFYRSLKRLIQWGSNGIACKNPYIHISNIRAV